MLSEGRGLLLTGGDLHLVQLRTRRPVLLDGGGLDALPYAIESAPEMDRILREVYGVDLLSPPEEARFRGSIPPEFTRAVWQSYTREQWEALASRIRRPAGADAGRLGSEIAGGGSKPDADRL